MSSITITTEEAGYRPRRKARWKGRPIDWSAYFFLAPFLVPFLLFTAGAILFGVYVAFTDWGILGAPEWVGLKNFEEALSEELVGKAFLNTLWYGVIIVPSVAILGFIFAIFVNQRWPGFLLARTAFYAPNVVSATVIGLVWVWILDTQFGLINQYLGVTIPWLTSTDWSLVGISIASIWWDLGLAFVLFLAALQEVDSEVREAAAIDGANRFQTLWYVVLPMIRPTISMVITLQLISTLRIFSQVHVMTNGGPASASTSVIHYIYNFGIIKYRLGYAAALSLMLFTVILMVTFLQQRLIRESE
ncbi:MAG: sugar ABC transporter permease [Chloroflexi bacterium]|nr:sugar ABC transporter permease [Chloroflexota bacterium]MCI0645044.1 sugar ABC transporter permease [Chloroflexota bacterium]